jgi:hypothetical protein
MTATSISRAARSKGYLVRGIDPIPENWEVASGYRALRSLRRSATVLERLIAEAVRAGRKAEARDLRSTLTAVERGHAHISGGFVISEIEPAARQWRKLEREAKRWVARRRQRQRPSLRLVVDNTRVQP